MSDLDRMLRELPSIVEPTRDLWPAIRAAARIGAARRRVLAAGGLTVAVSALVLLAVASRPREPDVLRRFDELARQYERTRAELDTVLADLAAWVDAGAIRRTRDDLEIIDAGIRDVRMALTRDPGSTELALRLAERYLRDRGLLEDTVRFLSRYSGQAPEGG